MPKLDRREFLIASGASAGLSALARSSGSDDAARACAVGLKADYIDRPLGLENQAPSLSWRIETPERSFYQSAYRVWVASSEELLRSGRGDLWDSGKVASRKSIGIRYQGKPLGSRQRCWWRVKIWGGASNSSFVSDESWWEMGLLDPSDWSASWLAVEDLAAEVDRRRGLIWVWGEPSPSATSRKFRLRFCLPAASKEGELFAVANGYWIAAGQVESIWVDGKRYESVWPGVPSFKAGVGFEAENLSGRPVTLPAMIAGEHLIAVEVRGAPLPPGMDQGFTLFARLNLSNGEILRIGSGLDWKTSLVDDATWSSTEYNDDAWELVKRVSVADYCPWPARPARCFRATFRVDKPVVKARLYATALGSYKASLNGRGVGDRLLAPEPSQYASRVQYQVEDVRALLVAGENAIGLTVGDGWYGSFDGRFAWGPPPCRVLAQLEIVYADGTQQMVLSGPDWRAADSPIRAAEMRIGEVYDARFEQPGWDSPRFDDSNWQLARLAERPSCRMVAQTVPPIRATQTLKPRGVTHLSPGVSVFDFGQLFAGWCRLSVQGPRGARVEMNFGESLLPSGEIDQCFYATGEPKRDIFILKGAGAVEHFEPSFTYRGIRYVQVVGLTTEPTGETLEGVVIHSDLPITGRLRFGHPLIEQIWRNTLWTQRSNFVGIPTDCPSREQRGFMGDAGVFWDAAAFNMDVCTFTSRHMDHVRDEQTESGAFPSVAPQPRLNNPGSLTEGSPAWADGGIILPWTAWRRYADVAIIERNWDAMNRHIQFLENLNPEFICKEHGLGDWFALDQTDLQVSLSTTARRATPRALIATAYWAHSTDLLSQMASAIGHAQDAERLRALYGRIREAFIRAFVSSDGRVSGDSQTGYILALQFGLLPKELREKAAHQLAAGIRRRGVSLTTGILGTQFILDVLVDGGFKELAYDLLLRTAYPSWGYMIAEGATAIWETWSGTIEHFNHPRKVSRNHYAFGSVCGFLYRRLAGIEALTPGFESIVIRPVLDERVSYGGGEYDSVMGRISTYWSKRPDGSLAFEVTVPANATARIYLPAQPNSRIEEQGVALKDRKELRILDRLDGEVVVEAGSGTYSFVIDGYRASSSRTEPR